MDTQSDSNALDVNQAAAIFASQDEPEVEKEPQAEHPATDEPQAEVEVPDEPQEADEAPAEDEQAEKTVPVVIDGKTVEVPFSEVVASYQKDKASASRFEEAAALRKQAQTETAQAQQERKEYAANLQQMGLRLQAVLQEQAQTDWNALAASDPAEWVRQRNLYDQRQAALQDTHRNLQAAQEREQAEQAQAHRNYLQEQNQHLLEKLPGWKDEAKAKAERESLKSYLKAEGYDDGAIGSISDHRAVVLARKAMLYDQMIAKASAAQKKVAALPAKVERPGVTELPATDKRTSAYRTLAKSGSVEDAAKLFALL